jgi:hypothetical protein
VLQKYHFVTEYGALLADSISWLGKEGHREEMIDEILNKFTDW